MDKKCFVLMPFAESYREIYEEVYKTVCKKNGLYCWRVDEIALPTSITNDIVQGIAEADIIIADLTSKNANVFYELGIAHTIGAQVIMTSQSISDIPFDIVHYRVIIYEQTISGSKILADKLTQAIKELLVVFERINNPVQEVLSNKILKFNKRVPIIEVMNFGNTQSNVRKMVEGENIMYADELKNLDLDKLKVKYHLGQKSLADLVSVIFKNGLYDDLEKLQKYVVENRLSLTHFKNKRFI